MGCLNQVELGVPIPEASSPSRNADPAVRISIGRGAFNPLPAWVKWLIDVGQHWQPSGKRRIALISMPCDSPSAGLVALGVMIRDLADSRASDVEGNFDALINYAKQYLEACRDCDSRCHPNERRCGFTSEASGKIRHKSGKLYGPILDYEEGPNPVIRFTDKSGTTHYLLPGSGKDYYEHKAPPIVASEGESLNSAPYDALASGAVIDPFNLRRTFSGTCLAGRVAGESATREWYGAVHFQLDGSQHSLNKLLTIHGWGGPGISRMTYFNTRTKTFDRESSFNRVVIADGHTALERVLATKEFDRSDVIAVLHRTASDIDSKTLGEKLAHLRQWYTVDNAPLVANNPPPRGVAVQVIKRGD